MKKGKIIKFKCLCVCVEDVEEFLRNIKGMCQYYSIKNADNQPSTDPLIICEIEGEERRIS